MRANVRQNEGKRVEVMTKEGKLAIYGERRKNRNLLSGTPHESPISVFFQFFCRNLNATIEKMFTFWPIARLRSLAVYQLDRTARANNSACTAQVFDCNEWHAIGIRVYHNKMICLLH